MRPIYIPASSDVKLSISYGQVVKKKLFQLEKNSRTASLNLTTYFWSEHQPAEVSNKRINRRTFGVIGEGDVAELVPCKEFGGWFEDEEEAGTGEESGDDVELDSWGIWMSSFNSCFTCGVVEDEPAEPPPEVFVDDAPGELGFATAMQQRHQIAKHRSITLRLSKV